MQNNTDTNSPTALPSQLAPQPSNLTLLSPPVSHSQAVAVIEARPLAPATVCSAVAPSETETTRKHRRHGRVASLPKNTRDMVNRMLWNGVPYKNIVLAIGESGYALTERNISNWSTGGYLEWRLEQEAVLQNRLDQDHLLDFLRRDDAPELPEVGLQAAATRLSQVLLHKLSTAADPEANLDSYTRLIDLLSRLNREIATSQKLRDDSSVALGPAHNPVRIKDYEHVEINELERFYSDPPSDAKLAKPAVPALVPAEPTSKFLADQDLEKAHEEKIAHLERTNAIMKAFLGKKDPAKPKPS